MSFTSISPLKVPEILWSISRFVTLKDAITCARVCKAWTDNFISVIWHTIDFDVHKLQTTDFKVLEKHGHHIRIVKNMKNLEHILVLLESNASKLRSLSLNMKTSPEFQAYFYDLMRRNNTTIEHIEIPSSGGLFFNFDCFSPQTSTGVTSKLSFLKFQGLTMTRDAFSSMLRICPCLTKLNMRDTTMSSWSARGNMDADHYQHHGITDLVASSKQVFRMDNKSENPPSLLVHFPNLMSWHLWTSSNTLDVKIEELKDEVAICCPLLKTLLVGTTAGITVNLLVKAFNNLTSICVYNHYISAEVVMAIVKHQDTLIHVSTFTFSNFFDSDNIPEVESNHLEVPGWIIQLLPGSCTRLKSLRFPLYEMNINDIEEANWRCYNLESLYIRVHGVNTKEKIDRAMQLWTDGRIAIRKKQMNAEKRPTISNSQLYTVILQGDNSIEARVARHLLKFNKLQKVWLGWKVQEV
ncbi:hypothetical protein BGZ65_005154 [Modicella reniformis]|uniref:F-box domain-containing protein n=1 Tax=Modicella reniformis TaxID=1440133 RepID=A0A9P6M8N4_9FUNG|nr:hypothetical protein BGZ65_005154 [Modicella reniformis]